MKCWIHDDWPTSYHRQREDGLYDFVNKYKPACISPDFNDEAAAEGGWQQHTEADARRKCGMVDVAGNPDSARCWLQIEDYGRQPVQVRGYYWEVRDSVIFRINQNGARDVRVSLSLKELEKQGKYHEVTRGQARNWCSLPPFGPRTKPGKPNKINDTSPIQHEDQAPPDEYAPQIFHRKPRCPKCHHKHKGYGKGTYVEKFGLFGCVCRGCGAEFWVSPKVPSVVRREVALILACIAVPAVPVGIIVLVARWIA